MTLPTLYRTSVGIHFAEREIRWIELRLTGPRLTVRRRIVEPVEADVAEALARIVDRARPGTPHVCTHVDPASVRHIILDGPVVDEPSAWISDAVRERFPLGTQHVVRYAVLRRAGDRTRVLAAIARREAIEARLSLLRDVGLNPTALGTVVGEVGHAFSFDPDFVQGRKQLLVVEGGRRSLLTYVDGVLDESRDADGADEADRTTGMDGLSESPTPLAPQLSGRRALSGGDAIAAALALRGLYPDLPAPDFLEAETVRETRRAADTRRLHRVALGTAAILVMLLAALTAADGYLVARTRQAGERALASSAGLALVEQARRDVDELAAGQLRMPTFQPTESALLLDRVGRAIPAGVLLDGLTIDGAAVSIRGTASDGAVTTELLSDLETDPTWRRVRLVFSETTAGVTRFEVAAEN